MILANRSVILLKIKEFKWAVQDLTLAIKTEKYPSENRYKLHQRLSKAYEYLENYESAEEEYRYVLKTLDSGKLTKNQMIQIKKETEKCISLCKKKNVAKNFISFESKGSPKSQAQFPRYVAQHPVIQNASGRKTYLS